MVRGRQGDADTGRLGLVFFEKGFSREGPKIWKRLPDILVRPIPPRQCDQALGDLGWLADAQHFGRCACDNGVRLHILGHDGASGNDRSIAKSHFWFDHCACTDPCVMADMGHARPAVRKEVLIPSGIVPVVIRPIEEVMTGRRMKRVVGGPDPRKGSDVGELADLRICDVGIAVTIAVIPEPGIVHPAAFANLDIGSKATIGDFAFRVNEGSFAVSRATSRTLFPHL